jgi:hypothetical protein
MALYKAVLRVHRGTLYQASYIHQDALNRHGQKGDFPQ